MCKIFQTLALVYFFEIFLSGCDSQSSADPTSEESADNTSTGVTSQPTSQSTTTKTAGSAPSAVATAVDKTAETSPDPKTASDDTKASTAVSTGVSTQSTSKISVGNAPNGPTADDRMTANLTATAPLLLTNVNPATFKVTKPFVSGHGRSNHAPMPGRIFVPKYGLESSFPACETPIPFQSMATLTPTIDGDLSDWGSVGLVSIDRAGDGFVSDTTDYDLKEFYFAGNATHYFLGFKMAQPWPSDTLGVRLILSFYGVTIPQDDSTNVSSTFKRNLELFGTILKEYNGTTYLAVQPSGSYQVAVNGASIEISIAKSAIDSSISGPLFSIYPSLWNGNNASTKEDKMGPNIVGLVDDYACLVAMPDQSFKMIPMRRLSSIDAKVAEVQYRAMAQAAPTVETVLNESHSKWDTIGMTVIDDAANPGVYISNLGIFITQTQYSPFGSNQIAIFEVAAHEYAHAINAGDYRLPNRWMVEGHSKWTERLAISSYYGKYAELFRFASDHDVILQTEKNQEPKSIDAPSWTQLTNYSEGYFYRKSSIFYDLLSTILPISGIHGVLKSYLTTGTIYSTSDQVLSGFLNHSQLALAPSAITANPWDGWFNQFSYDGGILPLNSLVKDNDRDLLFAFQESKLGGRDQSPKSLNDSYVDSYAAALGLTQADSWKHDHLVVDHLLDDWTELLPQELAAPVTTGLPAPHASCQPFATIKRLGILYDGDWLMIGIDFNGDTIGQTGHVTALIVEPSGRTSQVQWGFNELKINGFGPINSWSHTHHLLGKPGKTLEMVYHRSWLGWGKDYPAGTKIQLQSFMGASETKVRCSVTQLRVPTFIL